MRIPASDIIILTDFSFVNSFFQNSGLFHIFLTILPISSDTPDTAIVHITHLNTAGRRTGMHDLIISYVNAHMPVIADHISREFFPVTDRLTGASYAAGLSGCRDTEIFMHQMYKSGAVRAVCQAVSAQNIGISHIP